MPSINISEDDFQTVALAAHAAKSDGDEEQAAKLDKIARKMNASLTQAEATKSGVYTLMGQRRTVRWQDMPSVFDA